MKDLTKLTDRIFYVGVNDRSDRQTRFRVGVAYSFWPTIHPSSFVFPGAVSRGFLWGKEKGQKKPSMKEGKASYRNIHSKHS